jgi:hypothetical protein
MSKVGERIAVAGVFGYLTSLWERNRISTRHGRGGGTTLHLRAWHQGRA